MLEYMHYGQVANFKTNSNLPIDKVAIALNSRLKKTIVIKKENRKNSSVSLLHFLIILLFKK